MLTPLVLGPLSNLKPSAFIPATVQPLIEATDRRENVAPLIVSIAKSFGFDGFLFGVSLSLRPQQETQQFVYSTWSPELTRIYDQRAYIEVDPRIEDAVGGVLPVVWDQSTYRGRSAIVDEYLDVIQSYGVSSGVLHPVRDLQGRVGVMSLSSDEPVFDAVRLLMIERQMGDIVLFALYFHAMYISGVLKELVLSPLIGKPLTERELQCLRWTAYGLLTEQVAEKLGARPGTIQRHFDSIRGKLGAATRAEAVLKAKALGLI